MIRFAVILTFFLLLSGCSGIQFAEQKAGELSDSIVHSGLRSTCDRPTIASIMRTHCATKEGCKRWIDFCFMDGSPLRATWLKVAEEAPEE